MATARGRLTVAAVTAVPAVVLALFFFYPVAGILGRGLAPDGHLDLAGVGQVLGRARIREVLWFTVWTAGLATVLTALLGLPLAFVGYRLRFPGRWLVRAWAMVPFVLPTVVVGVAFRRLISASGPLGGLGLDGTPAAIVAALVFFNIGVVVRSVGSYWEALDRRPAEAAASLGASPVRVFLTVTLPALRPALASSLSVVFLFCATAFGVVLTLGGLRYSNVETEIYLLTTQELDLTGAAALSLLQLATIVALLAIAHRAGARRGALHRDTGQARRPGRRDLPVLALSAGVLTFVAAPVLTLVVASLRDETGWTLAHYRALQSTGSHHALLVTGTTALWHSLEVAVQAAGISVLLGAAVAFVVSRPARGRRVRRLRGILDGIFMLPLGVSAVTLGFGFLVTLNRPPLDLRTSPLLIPIAQALVALPLVVRTLAPVLSSIDPRQREAAASLGATPWRVLAVVDLAVGWRPLLAATGFAFAVSLGEFGATSFLARDDNPTLPVVIYRLIGHPGAENLGMATAASVLLVAATTAVMLAVERLRVGSMGAF